MLLQELSKNNKLDSRWKKCKGVLSQLTSGDSAARSVGICYNFELD